MRLAEELGDDRALAEASSDTSLAWLLKFARGRKRVAEIGTSAGWAAVALALADPERDVLSVDPFPHPRRDRYVDLAPETRGRIEFMQRRGEQGPPPGRRFDFLFIDDAHVREEVVATFRAWRPALIRGAVVVFHDYHPTWPGVIEAVDELGLKGRLRGTSYMWRA